MFFSSAQCLICAFNFALDSLFNGAFLFLLLFTPVCEVAVNGIDTAVNGVDTAVVAVNGVDTAVVISVVDSVKDVEAAIVSVVEAGVEPVLKNC